MVRRDIRTAVNLRQFLFPASWPSLRSRLGVASQDSNAATGLLAPFANGTTYVVRTALGELSHTDQWNLNAYDFSLGCGDTVVAVHSGWVRDVKDS